MTLILNVLLWKYINGDHWYYFMLSLSENPSTSFLVPWNLAHTWILMFMRFELKTLLFLDGDITVLAIQTFMEQLGFIITIGETSTATDLNNLVIHKCFCSMVVIMEIQRMKWVPQTQKYPELHDISTSHYLVWRYFGWLENQGKGEYRVCEGLQHGW